jgi:hypothetical protein
MNANTEMQDDSNNELIILLSGQEEGFECRIGLEDDIQSILATKSESEEVSEDNEILDEEHMILDGVQSEAEEAKEFEIELEEDLKPAIVAEHKWKEVSDTLRPARFDVKTQFPFEMPKGISDFTPVGLFKSFFSEDIWELFETQTNLYLNQKKTLGQEYLISHPYARLNKITHISQDQLKRWLAVRLLVPIHSNTVLSGKRLVKYVDPYR